MINMSIFLYRIAYPNLILISGLIIDKQEDLYI